MFLEALFIVTQLWELPKCTHRGEWVKRPGHMHPVGSSAEMEGRNYSRDIDEDRQRAAEQGKPDSKGHMLTTPVT